MDNNSINKNTNQNQDTSCSDTVVRTPFFFPHGNEQLFGWHHFPSNKKQANTGIVICPPIGYEYISSHRSIRHLADRFASEGIPTLRFDYHGTGDSAGIDEDPDRLQEWLKSIITAIRTLKEISGCHDVGLVGIRIGATLAARISEELELACLVLWAPCVNGRHYIREMTFLSSSDEVSAGDRSGDIEGAGFVISAQTSSDIGKINLIRLVPRKTSVLIVARDDLNDDFALRDQWQQLDLPVDYIRMQGFADFLTSPHKTKVPFNTIIKITDWINLHIDRQRNPKVLLHTQPCLTTQMPIRNYLADESHDEYFKTKINEKIVRFGSNPTLFGILCSPTDNKILSEQPLPTIILLNSGAVHHIGTNRLYVLLARHLAQFGITTFRMDVEGLGDSFVDNIELENNLYCAGITKNVDDAISYLKTVEQHQTFILAGLCFGSYAAFHAGLESTQTGIVECIIINPLTFYWKEGMSLDEEDAAKNIAAFKSYKRSFFKPQRWLKLLRGQVNVWNFFKSIKAIIIMKLSTNVNSRELNSGIASENSKPQNLSRDLAQLSASGIKLSFIIADKDPGYDLLMLHAKKTVNGMIMNNNLSIDIIPDSKHTFPLRSSRRYAIDKIARNVLQHYSYN